MGDCQKCDLRVDFNRPVRLTFVGSKVTSDAGPLAYRELDEALGLTATAGKRLEDSRIGRNTRHALLPLTRQSIYSRLALPKCVRQWSLTTLKEKLVKIGAKVTRHAKYVTFQMAEVSVPRQLFASILERIGRLENLPAPCPSG